MGPEHFGWGGWWGGMWVFPLMMMTVFLVVVCVVLLGSTPLAGSGWLAGFRDWLIRVPGMAGTRGLVLGAALGAVITGLRVILGAERPHAQIPGVEGGGRWRPTIKGLGAPHDR